MEWEKSEKSTQQWNEKPVKCKKTKQKTNKKQWKCLFLSFVTLTLSSYFKEQTVNISTN